MSDWLPDTPALGRSYCPGCEPESDPCREILDVRWCERHEPGRAGQDDDIVTSAAYLSGSGECGGEDNARFCAIIHGGARA